VSAAGILVVSADRRALTWNPALAEMLPNVFGPATTCCDLFGCRTPGTPLGGICLTEKALATRRPDELVLEPPAASSPLKVRVTPFHGGRDRTVLFEVGPAPQFVVAPPAEAPAAEPAKIKIRVLGDMGIETSSGPIKGDWLDQRAGRLLKFLVAHRDAPVHADAIAEALWPGSRADTTNTVRHFVHTLREKLEPERGRYQRSAFVLARNGGYQLNAECVIVDADEFESAAKSGLAAFAAGERETALSRLNEALTLYLDGKKDEAAAALPPELIDQTTLVGSADHIKERLAVYADAGVGTLMFSPMDFTAEGRSRVLRTVAELV
jgi:DNA-binding winged helix-turn-helix (wHTH) protein